MSTDMKHIGNGVYARISDKSPAHVAIWWTGDPGGWTGDPNDTDVGHDCDQMGCGSVGPHILAQRTVGASEPDDLAAMRAERDAALDVGEVEKARADALERSVFEALPVSNMAFTGDYGLYIRSHFDHITRALDAARVPDRDTAAERVELLVKLLREAEAKRDEACEAALEPMRESIDTHRALDDIGAPPGASPAERVRALGSDEAEAAQAARIAARVAARLPDHAPTLRVAVADLAAALGEDAPDTAELRAGDLVGVVAGLAARLAPRRGVSVSPIPEHLRGDLWQSAVRAPGWCWRLGMLTVDGYRYLGDAEDGSVLVISESGPEDGVEDRSVAGLEPDFTDPATLGCILALVRARLGSTAVVRKVGVQLVDGSPVDEWAICDTLVTRAGTRQRGPSFYGFRSEVAALVAGLWADVGGGS